MFFFLTWRSSTVKSFSLASFSLYPRQFKKGNLQGGVIYNNYVSQFRTTIWS
jgi:hypothetical protein